MKLNGWKRVGVIASTVWILGAGCHALVGTERAQNAVTQMVLKSCDQDYATETPAIYSRCEQDAMNNIDVKGQWEEAGFSGALAIIPMSLAWGAVYLIIFLA